MVFGKCVVFGNSTDRFVTTPKPHSKYPEAVFVIISILEEQIQKGFYYIDLHC